MTKYYRHCCVVRCCVVRCKDRVKKIDVRGIKEGTEATRTRKTWGVWWDEVNKRGRKEDERFASGMKEMESEEAKDSKGNEERSEWLFRGLVTACGYDSSRQTEASCVCVLEEGLWKQRWGGNSSPSRLWKIKEAYECTHITAQQTHTTMPA